MVLIGIDPHKATHTAVAIDKEETALGELTVKADRHQVERLLKWAIEYPDRRWATLAARVRVLGSGKSQKNDPNDALSTAIAALRAKRLRTVVAEDHGAILRLLVDHHHDLGSLRTQAICRLHALLRCLVPGGTRIRLSADGAAPGSRSGERHKTPRQRNRGVESAHHCRRGRFGHERDRVVRRGSGGGCLSDRPQRRHASLRQPGPPRLLQRHGSHRGVERSQSATPTEPPGQPTTQPRHPHDRHRPDPSPN